jgi:hypothetical protein
MANVSSYTFDNMSRIGLDNCNKSQTDIQNVATCNYTLQNYFATDCNMRTPIQLATTQPGIMYNGGYGSGSGGCNINTSSNLLIGTIQTHPKCRIDLFQRPFATVPYLGRGAVNPVMESQIQQGDMFTNRKSVNNVTETSFSNYSNTPMIPTLKATINNPANLIEGVAAEGWIRGGLPSRELVRDKEYTQKYKGSGL